MAEERGAIISGEWVEVRDERCFVGVKAVVWRV
jgi:hypothetical protein